MCSGRVRSIRTFDGDLRCFYIVFCVGAPTLCLGYVFSPIIVSHACTSYIVSFRYVQKSSCLWAGRLRYSLASHFKSVHHLLHLRLTEEFGLSQRGHWGVLLVNIRFLHAFPSIRGRVEFNDSPNSIWGERTIVQDLSLSERIRSPEANGSHNLLDLF